MEIDWFCKFCGDPVVEKKHTSHITKDVWYLCYYCYALYEKEW